MHDIKLIRQEPECLDRSQKRRGKKLVSKVLIELDAEYRQVLTELQNLQTQRNNLAQNFGQAKKNNQDTSALALEAEKIKAEIVICEEQETFLRQELQRRLSLIPNIIADDVPDGPDETGNVELRHFGKPPTFDFTPKAHYEIGEEMGKMDFEIAAQISGARFVVLYSELARLERALAAFMIDNHTKNYGYTEVSPPLLVSEKTAYGTGHLPKAREDMFQTNVGHWLIPTSEVVLTSLVADQIVAEKELPLRYTAFTPCFRAEAGAAGKDTRGMIRQHQFSKVELVSITRPHDSAEEHERMTEAAESILKQLKLPYRVMALCSGDIGFQANKTYDLEVWLPSQNTYREISSCSNCGDFQARRMNARYRPTPTAESQKPVNQFVHTLNGSGIAVGRAIVAILENYQQSNGCVQVPEVLIPYMGGIEVIQKKQ